MTTLLDLRTRAYQLMDEGQSQYLGVAEMNNYINNAAAILHNIIAVDDPWRVKEESFHGLKAKQHLYQIPDPLMRLLRVFHVTPQGRYTQLKSYNPSEYEGGIDPSYTVCFPGFRYVLMRNFIRIDPAPSTVNGDMLVLWYTPQYQPLLADTDTLPYYQLSGHEQWIINGAVIYAKTKEEVNSADLQMMNDQIMSQIKQSLQMRDRNSGNRIVMSGEAGGGNFGFSQYRFNY